MISCLIDTFRDRLLVGVNTKFPRQNSRIIQGYFKDLCMIFKDVKIRQKHQDSMLRYYNVPPKKIITKEYSHVSERNCREVLCNILVCRVVAPIRKNEAT